MRDGPNIAVIAALIGDRARADVLTALLADRALTATELADVAGVTKQTISGHLAKLVDAALITVAAQGRHRYFRLADDDVAQLLESLMGIAFRTGALRARASPREPALRRARICYDHLAGELGVALYEGLLQRRALTTTGGVVKLTSAGRALVGRFGMDLDSLDAQRRTQCRACLDWSERRYHLAGALGAMLLQRFFAMRWATRQAGSRVVVFGESGEKALRNFFASPPLCPPAPARVRPPLREDRLATHSK